MVENESHVSCCWLSKVEHMLQANNARASCGRTCRYVLHGVTLVGSDPMTILTQA